MSIRKKYKQEDQELAASLQELNINTAILEIKLLGLSKIKNNLLYECRYVDRGTIKTVPIIAQDVTQAIAKLDPYVDSAIPENVLKIMLGTERYSI
mgnify:FL=1|tara:strand:- start:6848 stop:7135 length:288 start_codon:yes stop_codon:yes gene_type:complete